MSFDPENPQGRGCIGFIVLLIFFAGFLLLLFTGCAGYKEHDHCRALCRKACYRDGWSSNFETPRRCICDNSHVLIAETGPCAPK